MGNPISKLPILRMKNIFFCRKGVSRHEKVHSMRSGNGGRLQVHRWLRQRDPQEGLDRQSRLSKSGSVPEVWRDLHLCRRGANRKTDEVISGLRCLKESVRNRLRQLQEQGMQQKPRKKFFEEKGNFQTESNTAELLSRRCLL